MRTITSLALVSSIMLSALVVVTSRRLGGIVAVLVSVLTVITTIALVIAAAFVIGVLAYFRRSGLID